MKSLELENFEMVELNANELVNLNGGSLTGGYSAP